eukprot:gene5323-6629_t
MDDTLTEQVLKITDLFSSNQTQAHAQVPITYNLEFQRNQCEGIVLTDYNVVHRKSKMETLFKALDNILLIRGPSQSGKTSLGQLFESYVGNLGHIVKRVSLAWPLADQVEMKTVEAYFNAFWVKYTGMTPSQLIENSTNEPVYIIIDDVQISYQVSSTHNYLWTILKGVIQKFPYKLRFLLIGSYGYDTIGSASAPISQLKSLDIDFLNYSKQEFQEACSKLPVPISNNIKEIIWDYTNGHIGSLYFCLNKIIEVYKEGSKGVDFISVNDSQIWKLFSSEQFFLDFVKRVRTFKPIQAFDNENAVNLLRIITETMTMSNSNTLSILCENDLVVITPLIKSGVLIPVESIDSKEFVFPSPICKAYYQMQLLVGPTNYKNLQKPVDLADFLHHTISYMDPSHLINSLSIGKDGRLNMSAFQMEFHRSAATHLNSFIMPYYGDRAVDLYIGDEYQWAIDITTEGSNVRELCYRFMPKGTNNSPLFPSEAKYYNIGKDWAVLDFRHHSKKVGVLSMLPNVWYIFYSDNYRKFEVHIRNKNDPSKPHIYTIESKKKL